MSSWRNAVLDIYSKHVLGYIDVISENERGLFVDEFTRRAKLTQEEKRQLFGSLPEKTEGVVDGSTTNFFCTTPQTFRIYANGAQSISKFDWIAVRPTNTVTQIQYGKIRR